MTYPPPQGHVQISHVHNLALCKEIGERLGISMGEMPSWNAAAFDDAHETIAR